jgi:hypothetical protein
MSSDDVEIKVDFKFMQSGWQYETRMIKESDLKKLLKDAKVVDVENSGWYDHYLHDVILRLKDGRKCKLTEYNEGSWEGSSTGWIEIFISEDWSE